MKNEYYLLSRKGICLLFLLLCGMVFRNPVVGQYVHTDGTQILDENGDDIYFSGMNLGNWLLWEGYLMMGDFNFRTHSQFLQSVSEAFGNDMVKAKEFEHQWRLNYLTQQGISDLKALGFNSVRVPFNYNMFWDGNAVKNDGFQYFDRVIDFCRNEGMYVMLDMHAAPGYQNPGDHSDNVDSDASQPRETVKFWDGNNIAIASAVWKHIANNYKNEPVVWGYDLINEPVLQAGREYELLGSMVTMRNAIREVDNNHIIIAEGNWWGSEMDKLDWTDSTVQAETGISARWDSNLVYQTHHYSTDVSLLDDRLAICDNIDVPMILGEYGESSNSNLRNMTQWCIDNNVDYFPWSFKKMSHDKCLWTINPNDPYEELKAFINVGAAPSASLYDDMIDFAQNNIANGSPGLVFDQGWYDATKPPCDLGAPSNLDEGTPTPTQVILTWGDTANGENSYVIARDGATIATLPANSTTYTDSGLTGETCYTYTVSAVGSCSRGVTLQVCTPCGGTQGPFTVASNLPGTIEAEDYDLGCNGQAYSDAGDGNIGGAYRTENVDISATVDEGAAGYNVGWIDQGEWLEYTVDVSTSGTYYLSYRVATPEETGQIQLKVNGATLSTTDISATGDWELWESVEAGTISLSAGQQVIQIYFSGAGVNLNSFSLSSGAPNEAPIADAGQGQTLPFSSTSTTLNGSASSDPDHGPANLTYSWSQTAGSLASISNTSAVSPTVYGLSSGSSYEFQLIVNDGSTNSIASSVTVDVNEAPVSFPFRLEAENYSSQNGIQTENCTEGGQNVGYIDSGDWIQFDGINIPSAGTYTITYRVASDNNEGTFDLTSNNGATNHGSVNVNESGSNGWQDWVSITQTVTLPAGSSDYRIDVTGSGFNINWLEITSGGIVVPNVAPVAEAGMDQNLSSETTSTSLDGSASSDADGGPSTLSYSWTQSAGATAFISNASAVAPTVSGLSEGNTYTFQLVVNDGEDNSTISSMTITVDAVVVGSSIKIEAEDFFQMSGLQTGSTSDNGGGQYIGWIDNGDWAGYNVDIPASGTYTVSYRVASQNGGGQIQLEAFGGGTTYGTVNVASTGGWQAWTTVSHSVQLTAGTQSLGLAFPIGGLNVNWIEISSGSNSRLRDATALVLDKPELVLYPNPARSMITISNLNASYDSILLYGVLGDLKATVDGNGLNEIQLDVSRFKPGMYFVLITQAGKTAQKMNLVIR